MPPFRVVPGILGHARRQRSTQHNEWDGWAQSTTVRKPFTYIICLNASKIVRNLKKRQIKSCSFFHVGTVHRHNFKTDANYDFNEI